MFLSLLSELPFSQRPHSKEQNEKFSAKVKSCTDLHYSIKWN